MGAAAPSLNDLFLVIGFPTFWMNLVAVGFRAGDGTEEGCRNLLEKFDGAKAHTDERSGELMRAPRSNDKQSLIMIHTVIDGSIPLAR